MAMCITQKKPCAAVRVSGAVVVVAIKTDFLTASALRVPTLVFCASVVAVLPARAADKLSYQTYKYVEDGSRMDVFASDLAIEKDFGTDYALAVDIGHDAISGATPCWQPKDGYASEYATALCDVADEVRNSFGLGGTLRDSKRNEYRLGVATSHEPDFVSNAFSAQGQWWQNAAHNRAYTLGLALLDDTAVATAHTNNTADKASKVYNLEAGVNQVIDRSSTLELTVFAGRDAGFLSNHYLKIVRSDELGLHFLADDARPDTRRAVGVGGRWIKSWSGSLSSNLWLRQYSDDWGIQGATLEGKLYWDINAQWRINPVLRVNKQGSADFYRSYASASNTFAASGYGSNDARLGDFHSSTVQLNAEFNASKNWTFNGGLAHYEQSSGLHADWLTLGFSLSY
jgi:hypothetical protein